MDKKFGTEESVIEGVPAITLDMDDDKLAEYLKAYIKKANSYFNETKKLKERRDRNKKFFFGRQVDAENKVYKGVVGDRPIKTYEKPYLDNVLKEGEDILRPLILSRLPDLIIKPGESPTSEKSAEAITKVVNNALTSREIKRLLTRAFRHHPVYFTGIIKYKWNPNKGKLGDIDFEVIHPENILVDSTATENNERVMRIIVHYVEQPIKDWLLMFPNKRAEIMNFAQTEKSINSDTEENLAVNLKIPEIWFDWRELEDEGQEEEKNDEEESSIIPKIKNLSGVCWMAGSDILKKELNPNWDWEGHEEYYYKGQPIPEEILPQIALLGMNIPEIEVRKTYKNFFGKPRKPFIFLGNEQWGEMAYDETSRIEENLLLQENYDIRGMQITKMIDDARGKHVFSKLSGLKKDTVEDMDLDNPDEDLFIDGDLRQVHNFIVKEQPSSQMLQDLVYARERILAKIHVNGPTRGEIQSDTATTNQIARESDFTIADDLADDTVNEVSTQMGEALLHMMKLRYTPEHFKAVLGQEGQDVFETFSNDIIEDGMEVDIYASGVDKLKAERQAKEEAQLGLIDPVTYFRDTNRSDPEKRAEMLFLFQTNPEMYFEKYIRGEDVPTLAEQIKLMNQARLQGTQQGIPQQQGSTQGGQPTFSPPQTNPQQPSPQNTGNIPTTPQGSPRNLIGRARQAIGGAITG